MLKWTSALLAIACLPAMAQAHEVWVERDGAGPARIYLGEPGDPLPEGGDPDLESLMRFWRDQKAYKVRDS